MQRRSVYERTNRSTNGRKSRSQTTEMNPSTGSGVKIHDKRTPLKLNYGYFGLRKRHRVDDIRVLREDSPQVTYQSLRSCEASGRIVHAAILQLALTKR